MSAGLKTGDLDIVFGLLRPDVVDGISKTDAKVEFRTSSNISALLSQPENIQRNTPLTNIKVRQALNYAIDKEAMAKNLFKGFAIATGQMSSPVSPGWDENVKPVPFDPAKAKALLAEAGYPKGFKLPTGIEFTPQTVDPNIATAIQANLKDVGIEAPINSIELAAFLDKYYGRNGQIKGDIFIQSTSDVNGFNTQVQGLYTCDKPLAWWCNPEFDKLMAQANNEPDTAKRAVILKKANAVFTADAAHINLIISSGFLITSAKVRGFSWDNTFFYNFDKTYTIE